MVAPQVTTYEVYLIDAGRWVLHARYRREEKDKAVEEAKLIERELGTQVKVTREVYNPSANTSDETTVYATEKAVRKPSGPRGGGAAARGGGGGGFGAMDEFDDARPGRGGAAAAALAAGRRGAATMAVHGTASALVRLVVILGVAVLASLLVTAVASNLLGNSLYMQLHPAFIGPLQFVIFIVTFLAVAVPLATKKVRWAGFSERPQQRARPAPAPRVRAPKAPRIKAEPEPEAEDEEIPAEEETKDEEPEPDKPVEEEARNDADDAPLGVGVEMQRETMGKFTQGLLSEVQKSRPQLDAYNRFGVSLMLAGAVDVVGDKNNLETEQRRTLLATALTDMGTKPEAARTFSGKYEEYMGEKRYMGMVQAGRVAAESFLENPSAPLPAMKSLFDAWGKPQQTATTSRIIAVMFTDMVGSTDMTQVKGDAAAQVIVRRHNSIVRAALNEYGGKQVKHTGDGIMASFPSPASAVEATIAIQRAVAANNARFPDQVLHLRIGINAGEPIEEEEDLFGATVQLAARVCAAAGTDQIVCTNVVRELTGSKATFVSRGPTALKGFSEKLTLYEVAWS